ncbi:MAG: RHS repeat domain-containing protein, partial [Polyangiaceae bacterium]
YQLKSASNRSGSSTKPGDLSTAYDATGNMTELKLHRDGQCNAGIGCNQVYRYEWDEVGRLVTAKRWDQDVTGSADPSGNADVELHYVYDAADMRVIKRAVDTTTQLERYTLYLFNTLELRGAEWNTTEQDFHLDEYTEVAYLFANGVRVARLAYEDPNDVPSINGETLHVFLELGDHLGSTSIVLDKATGELVQKSTYQAYGGSESDYRPARWKHFREDYRFTGKEEDTEVGLIYFGKRFLNPLLNRWISADPLAVHGLGSDPNLYAYVRGTPTRSVDPLGLTDKEARAAVKDAWDAASKHGLPTMVLFKANRHYKIYDAGYTGRDQTLSPRHWGKGEIYLTPRTWGGLEELRLAPKKRTPGTGTHYGGVAVGLRTLYEEAAHATLSWESGAGRVGTHPSKVFEEFYAQGVKEYTGAKLTTGATTTDPERLFDEAVGEYVGHRVATWWEAYERLKVMEDKGTLTKKGIATVEKYYNDEMKKRTFGYSTEAGVDTRTTQAMSKKTQAFVDGVMLEGRIESKFKSDKTLEGFKSSKACKDCK